jgi:hypothetical protein
MWAVLVAVMVLLLLSLPIFPNVLQAWGNNLAATAVIAGALAWHIRHPPSGPVDDRAQAVDVG